MGIRHHLHREYQIINPNNPSGNVSIIEITDIPTAETTTTKVLAPDGAGGVEFRAEAGGGGGGALVLLEQHTAADSAALDFTSFISSTYDEYQFEFINVIPATNSVALRMRMSTNGGSTYDSGANYRGAINRFHSFASGGLSGSGSLAIDIYAGDGVGSTTAQGGVKGRVTLYNPASATYYKDVIGQLVAPDGTNVVQEVQAIGGQYVSTTAVNAVRFLFSSGNIASGTIRVYGIAK